jgi:hypothetical protein
MAEILVTFLLLLSSGGPRAARALLNSASACTHIHARHASPPSTRRNIQHKSRGSTDRLLEGRGGGVRGALVAESLQVQRGGREDRRDQLEVLGGVHLEPGATTTRCTREGAPCSVQAKDSRGGWGPAAHLLRCTTSTAGSLWKRCVTLTHPCWHFSHASSSFCSPRRDKPHTS